MILYHGKVINDVSTFDRCCVENIHSSLASIFVPPSMITETLYLVGLQNKMEDAMVLEAGGPVDAADEIEEEDMVC